MSAAKDEKVTTPRTILTEWANKQDHWVRVLVGEVITARKPVVEARVEHFYDVLLREKGLKEGDAPNVGPLGSNGEASETSQTLSLTSIHDVENVNALVPGQRIEFNPRLTLLFGENGAGKTGYVRVLKRLASTRTAEEILPDIAKSNLPPPSATIEYMLDGAAQPPCEWKDQAGVPPFTTMDVFDARSAVIHVDPDLTYVYTPSELALFQWAAEAIDAVGKKLTAAQKEAASRGNPFTSRFSRESGIYATVETLGAATDLNGLRTLSAVSRDDEDGLEGLRAQVAALRSNTLADRLQVVRSSRTLLSSARNAVNTVLGFDRERYAEALQKLAAANARQREVSETVFASYGIPGVLGDTWRAFIEAGEAYIHETHPADYPQREGTCIYCRQSLDEAAARLLTQYRAYCGEEARREVTRAQATLGAVTSAVDRLDVEALQHEVQAAVDRHGAGAAIPEPLRSVAGVMPQFATLVQAVTSREVVGELPGVLGETATQLEQSLAVMDKQIEQLEQQSTDRNKALREESARLSTIESRLTLRVLMPDIVSFVERAKWADRAKAVAGHFQGTLKTLTDATKLASEDLLNHDFERLFQEECTRLRAPSVRLEFPGRKGQAARRKVLSGNHKPSEVLSEGEQKVIALADFIAEAALRKSSTPAILDDPVTSLDYKRIKEIVRRIVRLAADRQVVVFSHNIWFVMELLARFEKTPADCAFYEVEITDAGKGVVTRGTHPRVDTVGDLRKRINTAIAEAKKATGATKDALVERGYSLMRAFCEKTVEAELFQDIINRFRLNVMLTKLPQVKVDKMAAAIAAISPIYDKCCEITEAHSSPTETLNVRHGVGDLEADWKALEQARGLYV